MEALVQIEHEPTGLRQICDQYLSAYSHLGYKTIVVLLKGKETEELRARIKADKVYFLDLSNWQLKYGKLFIAIKLAKIITQHNGTFVVAHRFKASVIASYTLAFTKRLPVYGVIHGVGQLKKWRRKATAKIMILMGFRFLAVSEVVANDIKKSIPNIPSHCVPVVHNSINVQNFSTNLLTRDEARKTLGIASDTFAVGNIGRLSSSKDQLSLVRSFANFCRVKPNSRLIIVGEGRYRSLIQDEIETLTIKSNVDLTGELKDAWKLLKAFDLFVTTSVDEAFGLALLEAMLAKIPVIATDIPSYREVLGDDTILPACGDAVGIAEEMIASIGEKERVIKNYDRAIKLFSEKRFFESLKGIIQS